MKFKTSLLLPGLVMCKLRIVYTQQYRYMGHIKISMCAGGADLLLGANKG